MALNLKHAKLSILIDLLRCFKALVVEQLQIQLQVDAQIKLIYLVLVRGSHWFTMTRVLVCCVLGPVW